MKRVILIGFLCTATALHAQSAPQPDGRLLPLAPETLGVYLVQGRDTVRTGTLVDRLTVTGNRIVRIYDESNGATGPQLDTIVSTMPDLHPVSYDSRSARMLAHLIFRSKRALGWLRLASGESVAVNVPVPAEAYDGTSYDLVVRASPLREGFALTVPSFMIENSAIAPVTGRVTGSAVIDGHDCWVFAANFGVMPVTFWIDKANRALRQQLLRVSVDAAILYTTVRAQPRSNRT